MNRQKTTLRKPARTFGGSDKSTVSRVLGVMRFIAESNGTVRVKDLAEALDLPMSTSHRLLELVAKGGFVQKDTARRQYGPGVDYLIAANLVAQRSSIVSRITPLLDKLAHRSSETAILSLVSIPQRAITYAAISRGTHPIPYCINLYAKQPMVWGASGLAALAVLDDTTREEIIEHAEPSPVTGQRIEPAALSARLKTIRQQGYAVSQGERLRGAVGIAAPVLKEAAVIGSICLTVSQERFHPSLSAQFGDLVRESARQAGVICEMPDDTSR